MTGVNSTARPRRLTGCFRRHGCRGDGRRCGRGGIVPRTWGVYRAHEMGREVVGAVVVEALCVGYWGVAACRVMAGGAVGVRDGGCSARGRKDVEPESV
jgi:hypothetical protein